MTSCVTKRHFDELIYLFLKKVKDLEKHILSKDFTNAS